MKRMLINGLSLVLLSGCAALEQAPLLYSSTVTVGASTGVNSTESPGFNVVFGYKHVDAAYVPVAVAKPGQKIGESKTYDVQIIGGTQDTSNVNKGTKKLRRDQVAKLEEAFQLVKSLKSVKENIASQEKRAKQDLNLLSSEKEKVSEYLDVEKDKLASQTTGTPEHGEIKNRVDQADLELDTINARIKTSELNVATLATELKEVDKKHKDAETKLDALAKEYDVKLNEINEIVGDNTKKDAYSVYGSFDSRNTGGEEGATNNLGKVFSTGVAAQTLADAELVKANLTGVTQCFKELAGLIKEMEDDKKKEITIELFKLCAFKGTNGHTSS